MAVIPVVFFHADIPGWTGGFVGVDVFFVISGFLITSLIRSEERDSTFSFSKFYERRIKRIFPALYLVSFVSFFAAIIIFAPVHLKSFGHALASMSVFSSNLYFAFSSDYFAPTAELIPLLHSWSLAVEEQFYIVFPLIFIFLLRKISLKVIRWIGGLTLLVSFTICLWMTGVSENAAFYLPVFRAWELLTGAMLAVSSRDWPFPSRLRSAFSISCLALLTYAVVSYSNDTAFPGYAALAPVAATAGIIWSNSTSRDLVGSFLALRPLVAIGKASYSIYLWHWPVLVFARYLHVTQMPLSLRAMLIVASLICAWIGYRFWEMPLRYAKIGAWRTILIGTVTASIAVIAGLILSVSSGFPERFSRSASVYAGELDVENQAVWMDRGRCFLDIGQNVDDYRSVNCFPSIPNKTGTVLLWGDSFASHYIYGLRSSLTDENIAVGQFTAASCRPFAFDEDRCGPYLAALPRIVRERRPQLVIMAAYWLPLLRDFDRPELKRRVQTSLRWLRELGLPVIMVGQSPVYDYPVPLLPLYRAEIRVAPTHRARARDIDSLNAFLADIAREEGVIFYDPSRETCTKHICTAVVRGEALHWDFGHFSKAGSIHFAAPLADLVRQNLLSAS